MALVGRRILRFGVVATIASGSNKAQASVFGGITSTTMKSGRLPVANFPPLSKTALPGLTRGTDYYWRLAKEKERKKGTRSEQNIHSLGWRRKSDSGL